MVRNDERAFAQEFVGHADAFAEQSTGILAEIEDEPFRSPISSRACGDFVLGGLVESSDVHVADAGPDHEMEINAVAGNLVADDSEVEWLVETLAQDVMWTVVPLGPFRRSATSLVLMLSVGLPSTAAMMSPGRMPALYAGVPTKGAMTMTLLLRGPTVMPTP